MTSTGGYSYVSQSDAGEMIALAPGERLHKLSRTGKVLADFPTMVSDGAPQAGPVNRFHGPFSPEISPDGTKVAYEWFNDSFSNDTGCSATTVPPCSVYSQSQGVGISSADHYTGPEAFGVLTGWIYPHWMSADVLLRSFSGAVLNDDAVFTTVGPGMADSALDPWFFDERGLGVDDVELSRDLSTVVGIAGQSSELLRTYRTVTHPFGAPDWNHQPFHQGNTPVAEQCSELTGTTFESTSLAPDSRGLAYGTAEGIWVAPLAGCQLGRQGSLLIPGGRFPDWGPADLPSTAAGAVKPSARVASASLRRGIVVRVQTSGPGRVTVTAMRGKRKAGSGRAKVGASGTAKVRVRVARKGKVALKVAFSPADGAGVLTTKLKATVR